MVFAFDGDSTITSFIRLPVGAIAPFAVPTGCFPLNPTRNPAARMSVDEAGKLQLEQGGQDDGGGQLALAHDFVN
jgi:hypothetical protein